MKKILFPTDFSETANNALIYALKMAENQNATLVILHAYEMPVISATANPVMVQEVYESIELSNFENFKDQVPFIRDIAQKNNLSHVPMQFILEEGFLSTILKNVVDKESIDLVVMGTSGNSGWEQKLIGSNTANAISSLKIPVLSIPHDAIFTGINTLGFSTLFNINDKKVLDQLIIIAKGFNAKIKCIHVAENPDAIDKEMLTTWTNNYREHNVQFVIVEGDNVEDELFNFIDRENIDILVSVKRNRNFWQRLLNASLTKKLSYHTNVPFIAFHEEV